MNSVGYIGNGLFLLSPQKMPRHQNGVQLKMLRSFEDHLQLEPFLHAWLKRLQAQAVDQLKQVDLGADEPLSANVDLGGRPVGDADLGGHGSTPDVSRSLQNEDAEIGVPTFEALGRNEPREAGADDDDVDSFVAVSHDYL